jgi:DNA-binding NarL/FixJ family response regulator
MTSVTAGALNTLLVGVIYCAVLSACQRHLELRRSQEWTAAFSRWCDSQPGLMPFRGDCLVYRAELLQLRGAWPNALEEARRACAGAEEPSKSWWAGPAFYQQGEVNRLRGDYTGAEEAYRKANEWGCSPQPGLALLRLAQGRGEPALSSLSRALAETQEAPVRARLLAALVEILLAANDNAGAEAAAQELAAIVAERKLPVLEAVSWQATGAVMLAAGDATAALTRLRNALNVWRSLEVPYEAARSRVLMAQACRALGDADSAQLELDTARAAFAQLGALPDVRRVDSLSTQDTPPAPGSLLTPRELEVLRLVAAGNTNRAIAETLVLSEKTVARHVSNIFARLGISSRSAATAYAYEHKLIS